jgi:glycosyltransferase involved in cell wall biosynthesis
MNQPEVSVVMSVYNNADTLPAALQGILSQEGVALEFIVVDDGSTDASASILDEAARQDARLRVVHTANEGLTRALVRGCGMAAAPWIARQDADDVSLPGRLKAQLALAMATESLVLVGCGAHGITAEGDRVVETLPPQDVAEATHRVLVEGQAISPHGTILFHRDAYETVGGYRRAFYYAQDIDLTIRLAERGGVAAVPRVLYEYRLSPSAISGTQGEMQRAFYRLIREGQALRQRGESEAAVLEQAEFLRRECILRKPNRRSEFLWLYHVGCLLKTSYPARARYYLWRALVLRPWSAKAFVRWAQVRWFSQLRRGG